MSPVVSLPPLPPPLHRLHSFWNCGTSDGVGLPSGIHRHSSSFWIYCAVRRRHCRCLSSSAVCVSWNEMVSRKTETQAQIKTVLFATLTINHVPLPLPLSLPDMSCTHPFCVPRGPPRSTYPVRGGGNTATQESIRSHSHSQRHNHCKRIHLR